MIRISAPFAAICAATLAYGGAEQPHSDIGLAVSAGQIVTGSYVDSIFTPGARVFESELGEVIAHFTDDPGFNAPSGSGFPPGSTLSFNILDALRRYDAPGMDFDDIPAETLTINLAAASRTTPSIPDTVVPGFAFAAASGTGSVHQHINFFLNTPQGAGIYLLKLELVSSSPTIAPSEPFYIVFNDGRPESEHEAAVAAAETLLVPACPGDVNRSGTVDVDDLNGVLSNWLVDVGVGSVLDLANSDGLVTVDDLNVVLSHWQASCP